MVSTGDGGWEGKGGCSRCFISDLVMRLEDWIGRNRKTSEGNLQLH